MEPKFCPKCGYELGSEEYNYCPKCGSPLKFKRKLTVFENVVMGFIYSYILIGLLYIFIAPLDFFGFFQ